VVGDQTQRNHVAGDHGRRRGGQLAARCFHLLDVLLLLGRWNVLVVSVVLAVVLVGWVVVGRRGGRGRIWSILLWLNNLNICF